MLNKLRVAVRVERGNHSCNLLVSEELLETHRAVIKLHARELGIDPVAVVDDGRDPITQLGFVHDFFNKLARLISHAHDQDFFEVVRALHEAIVPIAPGRKQYQVDADHDKKYDLRLDVKDSVGQEIKISCGRRVIDEQIPENSVVKLHIVFACGQIVRPIDIKDRQPYRKQHSERPKMLVPDFFRQPALVADHERQEKRGIKHCHIAQDKEDFLEITGHGLLLDLANYSSKCLDNPTAQTRLKPLQEQ